MLLYVHRNHKAYQGRVISGHKRPIISIFWLSRANGLFGPASCPVTYRRVQHSVTESRQRCGRYLSVVSSQHFCRLAIHTCCRSQGVGQLIMAVGQLPIGIKAVRHLSTNADINFSQPRGLPDFSPCACYCVCVKRESGHNMSVHPDISM